MPKWFRCKIEGISKEQAKTYLTENSDGYAYFDFSKIVPMPDNLKFHDGLSLNDGLEMVKRRIMFFFESHWNEMVKFSRRTAKQLANWATRRGYQAQPADILDDAKKKRYERYTCVNIAPSDTVEIRLFRGTLKFNTFIAALEMVDSICENAVKLTDEEIQRQSWSDFVTVIDPAYTELIQYLKEKRLYINEPVLVEAEI